MTLPPPVGTRESPPFVGFVERVLIVGGVARVDLGESVASQQSYESLVHQCSVGRDGTELAGLREQGGVDRGAQPCARRATIMLRTTHPLQELPPGGGSACGPGGRV